MLNKVFEDPKYPFDIALQWCVTAKNSAHNIHGFSLYQLALGQNPRISLLNNKLPAYGSNPPSAIIRQNLNAFYIARNAFIQSENSERLCRAMAHNIQHSNDSVFVTGDHVYYKRAHDPKWHGPSTVLGHEGQQILLKHGGFYTRVHHCRVQHVDAQACARSSITSGSDKAEIQNHIPEVTKAPPAVDNDTSESDSEEQQTANKEHNVNQKMSHVPHLHPLPHVVQSPQQEEQAIIFIIAH